MIDPFTQVMARWRLDETWLRTGVTRRRRVANGLRCDKSVTTNALCYGWRRNVYLLEWDTS
jgi:hypothetical protein